MKTIGNRSMVRRTAAALISFTLLFPTASAVFAADKSDADTARLKEVLDLIEQNHVSAPTKQRLTDVAIQSMVESLKDPYTIYFTPDELKQFQNTLENNYVGIGVRIRAEENNAYITEVFDGPAKKAGMLPGDRITAVNGELSEGLKLDDVTKKIMGPEGTAVSITVERNKQSLVLEMTRQTIQIPVVTHKRFDQGVGYIRVTGFSSEADEQTAAQLDDLKKQGINSLILDLRDNPGGLVETAQNMAKLFVKEGVLIHTKDKNNVDKPVTFTNGTTQPFPLYILVNEYSASASEVLTGALQDYNVVTKVIGKKTYGKGSVQSVFPLSNGGALKVTIEEYLTPKLRKVNKVGLNPDLEVDGEVPQLITALHEAGLSSVNVQLSKKGVSVNQIDVEDSFDVVRSNGELYVPSRLLSSLLGGSIQWNAEQQAVDVTVNGTQHSYSTTDGSLSLQNGSSYLNVIKFKQDYTELNWSDNDGQVELSVSKG
ncbi:S41 family peptidase [Paenibacillus sp. UNC451MF]|uniref:S41 family peptidase n=1 Tax=Paenibacillus sp. UNC451MF TaxID=1449063 RepID=UPI00049194E3|nr:S41 family peptidase [Paenibacillus sp. UNC451MF]